MYETTGMRQQGSLWELAESLEGSPYYNHDLAPTTASNRTWSTWNIAALWIGMAVCIPTYYLARELLQQGMTWWQAALTILLGNLIVLVPMCLNAHAGTKYGIPFPVLLRSSFGVWGSNLAGLLRAIVACGWFGILTWIGGEATYRLMGVFYPERIQAEHLTVLLDLRPHLHQTIDLGLNGWQALCFLLFWLVQVLVVTRGIESIKWLESLSAPFLLGIGIALLVWAVRQDGIRGALSRSGDLQGSTLTVDHGASTTTRREVTLTLQPLRSGGAWRTRDYQVAASADELKGAPWRTVPPAAEGPFDVKIPLAESLRPGETAHIAARFRNAEGDLSSVLETAIRFDPSAAAEEPRSRGFLPLLWPNLFLMIAYWATLSLNIPDFTRFARSQRSQVVGQAFALPTAMVVFSLIGIAVTSAAVGVFSDIQVREDAPWDPVRLLVRFRQPWVVGLSMLGVIIATLTTNLAANVVAPSNCFSSCSPNKVSFRVGGWITAFVGALTLLLWKAWDKPQTYVFTWLRGYGLLLGPIAGIMIADYLVVRRARLRLPDLYKRYGIYRYCGGTSLMALFVLLVAIAPNVPGFLVNAGWWGQQGFAELLHGIAHSVNAKWDPSQVATCVLGLHDYAWFIGFGIAFFLYSLFGLIVRKV